MVISTTFEAMNVKVDAMNAKVNLMKISRRLFTIISFLLYSAPIFARSAGDSIPAKQNSSLLNIKDSIAAGNDTLQVATQPKIKSFQSIVNDLLLTNKFINARDKPVYIIAAEKNFTGKEFLFYSLCILVLILGVFKTFYRGYFNNLFRVFFNTSLRQTQLTDQLLQAKLPSFILNIFFTIY